MHFCHHFTFHFKEWTIIKNELLRCVLPLELAENVTPKLPRDYIPITYKSTKFWSTFVPDDNGRSFTHRVHHTIGSRPTVETMLERLETREAESQSYLFMLSLAFEEDNT